MILADIFWTITRETAKFLFPNKISVIYSHGMRDGERGRIYHYNGEPIMYLGEDTFLFV